MSTINLFDALKISLYNGIRKVPTLGLFTINLWITYGFIYDKIGTAKKYFDEHRLKELTKRRKIVFSMACKI